MKPKLKSLKKLKKQAWTVFSIWVRKSNADFAGYVICSTCGKAYIWNSGMIHAGHWEHDKLDFDERNVHPQCRDCNNFRNKNTNTSYAIYMAGRYGLQGMEQIKRDAREKGNNYTRIELEEIIKRYKELTK